jgi:protein SCO1/2
MYVGAVSNIEIRAELPGSGRPRASSLWSRVRLASALVAGVAAFMVVAGCDRSEGPAGFPVADPSADCLPDMTFTDAHGRQLSLASLRGGPVLFDFVFTRCPGPCETLTTRLDSVARQLTDLVGTKVHIVSITVDPEHDGPAELLAFARARGADREGWSFLSGSPAQVDQLMARFSLTRKRTADGSVDHVLEFFLVGPDGRPLRQYLGVKVDPAAVARDARRVAAGGNPA